MASEPPRLRLEMPFLLMAGMVLSAFIAVVGGLAFGLQFIAGSSWTALVGDAGASDLVERLHNGSLLTVGFTVLIGFIAWGLWREKSWTRHLMVGFWGLTLVVAAVLSVRGLSNWGSGCMPLIGMGLATAYLYGKQNVRAYYRALETAQIQSAVPVARGGTGGAA